jgi:glycosyltransferase involved in cell wall biosynthesis
MELSIIVPVYNEKRNIEKILSYLLKTDFNMKREIIIVDDCSTDGTKDILLNLKKNKNFKIIFKKINEGKGSAVKKGFLSAKGKIIAIQDADLEYYPSDLKNLVLHLKKNNLKVVYGSRFLKGSSRKTLFYFGNIFLSKIVSFLYGCKITDMETCYKVFDREIINKIKLESKGFGFDPEITCKMLNRKYEIVEIPIRYNPRTKKLGKKIRFLDGLIAIYYVFRCRFINN